MSPRYLLIAGNGQTAHTELLRSRVLELGLEAAFSRPDFTVFVNAGCPCLAAGGAACVIGTLFHRHGLAEQITGLSASDAAAIVDSDGDALLRKFWGGYVAALGGPGSVTIMRDPSAALPCYFTRADGFTAFASDAEILVQCGLIDVEFDWPELGRHFYNAGVPSSATPLRGISELLAGFSLRIQAEEHQVQRWSPWDHVRPQEDDRERAAERLSRTVKQCVRAWAAGRGRLLLSISGGLDSSIVAAALAEAKTDVTCLTMYGEDPSSDERHFARALCTHLGLPLIERSYELDAIDLAEPLGAHLPRCKDSIHTLAYEQSHLDLAREIRVQAFVTGNGGDSVFGYSQSAAPIADRILSRSSWEEVFRTLRDVCAQTGCSIFDAAVHAWRTARGPRAYNCRTNPLFLDSHLLEELAGVPIDHPWLRAPADALPGKAAHIAWILRVQQCLQPNRSRYLPVLNPLMSQPIVETCLGIPTWEWRAGGQDRSVARRAFAADLPALIVNRHVKGSPSYFAAQVLDHYRPQIRERLLDGRLTRSGVAARGGLEAALSPDHRCTDEQRVRILEFVATEAWLDSWASHAPPHRAARGDIRVSDAASFPVSADPNG